jgi:hypothetical protein
MVAPWWKLSGNWQTCLYVCFVIPDLIRNPVLLHGIMFLDAGSSPA